MTEFSTKLERELYEALERSRFLAGLAIYKLRQLGDFDTAQSLANLNIETDQVLAKAEAQHVSS